MLNLWIFFCFLFCAMVAFTACGDVLLSGNNLTISFQDIEANFAPSVKGSGKRGILYIAEPLDACSPLMNKLVPEPNNTRSPFLLMIRGKCSFEDKVRAAETAGFEAAIVYDNEDGDLISMAGNSAGIKIYAVFVSKIAGEILSQYAAATALDMELWIIPSLGNPAWSILAISFISLLAMSAVLATCFFVRRHHIRREHPQAPNVREFHGLSSRLVKAMPSLIFTAVLEDNSTSSTCAICLEDYTMGEKLRVLPCCHKFHAVCVDAWLTSWRTFCPVCKRDARNAAVGESPASESTPLLASRSPSMVSPSVRSALPSPEPMHIRLSSSRPSSVNTSSISSSYHHRSFPVLHHSHLSASRSSADLRNASSQRSDNAYLFSPHSPHSLSLSSVNPRYISPYIPSSPLNASSSHMGASIYQANHLHYSESHASFSPFVSAQSLPGC